VFLSLRDDGLTILEAQDMVGFSSSLMAGGDRERQKSRSFVTRRPSVNKMSLGGLRCAVAQVSPRSPDPVPLRWCSRARALAASCRAAPDGLIYPLGCDGCSPAVPWGPTGCTARTANRWVTNTFACL